MPAYPATFTPDAGTVMVTFPDLPEAITSGADIVEAFAMAADCLEEVIAARIRDREDIPPPSPLASGQHLVPVPTGTALKALVHAAMRAEGLRKADLARRLGWSQKQVDRLLDPQHESRMEAIDMALLAMGRRVEVHVTPLAAAE